MIVSTTAIYVAFGTDDLDLSWIPPEAPVVIVHNDDRLTNVHHGCSRVTHIHSGGNIGFGAAVNLGLTSVATDRVALCNPDTRLSTVHWEALSEGEPNELVAVPLVDGLGRPQAVINRYPTPLSLTLTAYSVGRLAPRGGSVRNVTTRLLGAWGRQHRDSLGQIAGTWPLSDYWPAAAACSYPTTLLRAVNGFDSSYFLYLEDTDLAGRIAQQQHNANVRMSDVPAGIHSVGGASDTGAAKWSRDRHQLRSAQIYASRQSGIGWRACEFVIAVRARLVGSLRR